MSKKNIEVRNKTSNKSGFIDQYTNTWRMSHAPTVNAEFSWFQMLPVIIFTAFVIMITRMAQYTAPVTGYYWHSDQTKFVDFFSYYKSVVIIFMGLLVLTIILYKMVTQSLVIKKTWLYIPAGIYTFFVILSYILSPYKYFALHGWLDRFEGTIVILCYMLMLFYIINTVNTEKQIKWIIYSLGISSTLLGILGLSQFLNHDFFKTTFGKELITPSYFWPNVDKLRFTFTTEIYQTVYNINYVSFYLTLLVPIAGLLFIAEKNWKKKIIYGVITGLLIFNILGSKSSSGVLGLGVAFIIALIILNRNLIKWWKSIIAVLGAIAIILALTFNALAPEIENATKGIFEKFTYSPINQYIDFMDTNKEKLIMSCNNEPLTVVVNLKNPEIGDVKLYDKNKKQLNTTKSTKDNSYTINDQRFKMYNLRYVNDDGRYFLIVKIESSVWPFEITKSGIFYYNRIRKLVDLDPVPSIGFKYHEGFGSGRGYIWSRSLPLLKDRLFIGSGADTYCLVFPHKDYVGKINAPGWADNTHIIVDKPHDMYIQTGVNTGIISLIAELVLFFGYVGWCFKIYLRKEINDFTSLIGVGIFIGICGFLIAALFNDSSVSVAPMFWGLLGTGIAINFMLSKKEVKIKE